MIIEVEMLEYATLGLAVVHQTILPVHVAVTRHEVVHGLEDAMQLSRRVICLVQESLALTYPGIDMVEPFRDGIILESNRSVQYISSALRLIIRFVDVETGKGEVL